MSDEAVYADPSPAYFKVQRHLVSQIDRGVFKPGDPVPTEAEICKRYGVSRTTARRAIAARVAARGPRPCGSAVATVRGILHGGPPRQGTSSRSAGAICRVGARRRSSLRAPPRRSREGCPHHPVAPGRRRAHGAPTVLPPGRSLSRYPGPEPERVAPRARRSSLRPALRAGQPTPSRTPAGSARAVDLADSAQPPGLRRRANEVRRTWACVGGSRERAALGPLHLQDGTESVVGCPP